MKKILIISSILLLFSFVACEKKLDLESKVSEYTLSNGMKWLLVKRGYAPVFAGVVQVRAGGADEVPGKTGLAHLLEHMAFKGTSKIGTNNYAKERDIMDKIDILVEEGRIESIAPLLDVQREYIESNEIWQIFTRNGAANLNAYTTKDVTAYHAEMPNSKLELWSYLLSEMISDPAFREFYPERSVVLEELRTSLENSPRGRLYETLLDAAFKKSPYGWPTIGRFKDVAALTRNDMKEFYKNNYLPECMVGSIVGDIDIEQTKKMIEKYFGNLKGKGKECKRIAAIETPQTEIVTGEVAFDAEPMLLMAFHKPTAPSLDDYVFDIFAYALCEGDSARMQKSLVTEKKLAKRAYCFNSYPGTRLPNLFVVYAEPFSKAGLKPLEDAIMAELKGLETKPIEPSELKKVKNQMKTSFLLGIDSNFELAHTLVTFENLVGDWRYVFNHSKNIDKITDEEIMTAAKNYFVPENTTIVKLRRDNE